MHRSKLANCGFGPLTKGCCQRFVVHTCSSNVWQAQQVYGTLLARSWHICCVRSRRQRMASCYDILAHGTQNRCTRTNLLGCGASTCRCDLSVCTNFGSVAMAGTGPWVSLHVLPRPTGRGHDEVWKQAFTRLGGSGVGVIVDSLVPSATSHTAIY